MSELVEYITANYTWFLIGAIIILLAIIGSYADKTNFGQGKIEKDDASEDEKDLNKKIIEENNGIPGDNSQVEFVKELKEPDNVIKNESVEQTKLENNVEQPSAEQNKVESSVESKVAQPLAEQSPQVKQMDRFTAFDKEFESVLPKKELISGDLLADIENLSLDSDKKNISSSVPDLDDLELPKIKEFEKENEDIWKF